MTLEIKDENEKSENGASYDRLDFSSSVKDEMTFEKLLLQSDGDLVLPRDMLRRLTHGEVLVKKHPAPKRRQFYKNVIPSYQLKPGIGIPLLMFYSFSRAEQKTCFLFCCRKAI